MKCYKVEYYEHLLGEKKYLTMRFFENRLYLRRTLLSSCGLKHTIGAARLETHLLSACNAVFRKHFEISDITFGDETGITATATTLVEVRPPHPRAWRTTRRSQLGTCIPFPNRFPSSTYTPPIHFETLLLLALPKQLVKLLLQCTPLHQAKTYRSSVNEISYFKHSSFHRLLSRYLDTFVLMLVSI